jgi:hypothetical protein
VDAYVGVLVCADVGSYVGDEVGDSVGECV